MRIEYTPHFERKFEKLPKISKRKLQKQIDLLLNNIRHPSLHAKKFNESEDIWQARLDYNVRFYFKINNDLYSLLDIKKHSD